MIISILFIMLAVSLVFLVLSKFAVDRIETNHYEQRADFFRRYPINPGDIVFLGDSITDGGCWEELFPGVPVKNRGINGDSSVGVLKRVDDILLSKPSALFLLIGTNDIPLWAHHNVEEILLNWAKILERCAELSPSTKVFVQSLLPRHKRFAKRIIGLNAQLRDLTLLYHYTYLDLHSSFVDQNGGLRHELTNDNLHLLADGYALWVEILSPHIEKLVKKP